MELHALLQTIGLFEGLDVSQLKRIAELGELMTVDKDTVIFSKGAEGDRLYIVSDGQVKVQIGDDDDLDPSAQVILGRGQVFGEIALIDHGPRSATMICINDNTELYTISHEEFSKLCTSDTAIGYVVMRNLAADLSFKLRHRNLSNS
jgi:CRP-like cAMP-binding protein